MSEEMKKLFWELKQFLVQYSPNWNTLCDIEQYILDLEQENKKLKEFKEEHKIMKQILIEHDLWETLLNDDRFLRYLKTEKELKEGNK